MHKCNSIDVYIWIFHLYCVYCFYTFSLPVPAPPAPPARFYKFVQWACHPVIHFWTSSMFTYYIAFQYVNNEEVGDDRGCHLPVIPVIHGMDKNRTSSIFMDCTTFSPVINDELRRWQGLSSTCHPMLKFAGMGNRYQFYVSINTPSCTSN